MTDGMTDKKLKYVQSNVAVVLSKDCTDRLLTWFRVDFTFGGKECGL